MSQTVTQGRAKLQADEKLRGELASERLSKVLRRGTWGSHRDAEFSPFEQALVKGSLPRDAYVDLLIQTQPIYAALERGDAALAGDRNVNQIIFPGLDRTALVERDLAFYLGQDWQADADLLAVTDDYVARIDEVVANEPIRYIAHHYTRYLADLSGGIHIDSAIQRAYDLDVDGHRVYDFAAIGDTDQFKVDYRSILDGLDVDVDDKVALMEETMIAYEFNIEQIKALSDRHDIVTAEPAAGSR